MANENEIPLNITADTDAAQKQLEQFTAAVTKLMGNLNQSIDNGISKPLDNVAKNSKKSTDQISSFFSNIKVAAAAAFAVFAGKEVIGFFSDAIKEGAEADKVLEKFNFTLATTGEYSLEASKSLQEYAASIQESTTFTDDAVLSALTLAKTFGLTNDAAKNLVGVAVNLAAVQGTDLATATDKLLQSLNGQGRALKDLGPEFANLTTEQNKAGEAVRLADKRLTDAAKTLTGTFAGASTQASNAFGEFQETVGKIITNSPDVIKAISALAKIFNIFAESVSKNEKGFSQFLTILVTGMAEAADFIVNGIAIISTGFLELGKVIGRGASFVEAGFALMTGNAKKADLALQDARFGGNSFVRTLDGLQIALDKAAKLTRDTADSIGGIGDKSKKSDDALKKINATADKSKIAFGKLTEEAIKFSDTLLESTLNPFQKAASARDKELAEINKFLKSGSLNAEKANELRFLSEQKFEKSLKDLKQKASDEEQNRLNKAADDLKKSLEERKKLIEGAFKDPIQAIINFDASQSSATEVGAAIGLGAVSQILDGAKGAQKVLAASVGGIVGKAAGDAFGPIATQITDQLLTLGPDGAKAMVREFVDALPDLIIKLADAIPAVVEALVDSLVNKGGAIRIAVAIARAMSGEASIRALGKQIGASFSEVANDELIKTARNMAIILAVPFFGAIYVFRNEIKQAFVDAANQIGPVFAVAGGQLAMGFKDGISGIFSGFSSVIASIAAVGPLLSNPLSGALDRIPNLGDGISNKIKDAANFFKERVDLPFDSIKDFLSNFKIDLPNIGGSDDGFLGTGLATGGLVPPGYNNDTFPARLTSGELVIPKDLVGSLSDFLDVGLTPKKDNGDLNTAILGKIAALLGQPVNVESSINISGQVFADIMLKLSRNNARITA